MDSKLLFLNNKINTMRKNLYFLMTNNEPTDEVVVKCSQKLDKLIVEYENKKAILNLH